MSEAEETIKNHIESLPPKIQKVLASIDIQSPLKEVSDKYSLLLDKASALETETVLVVVGLESGEDFVDNIIKNVEVSEVEAIAMSKEIDERIFSQIRHKLQEESGSTEARAEGVEDTEDDILSQIEKPSPVGSRIGSAPKAPEPATKPEAPLNLPTEGKNEPDPKSGIDDAEQKIIETKLKESVVNPFQKTEVGNKSKRSYPEGSDPYKEAIE